MAPSTSAYVSNFAGGGVIRIEPGASPGEVWIAPGAFETRSTFGVLADEASGTLWVCRARSGSARTISRRWAFRAPFTVT